MADQARVVRVAPVVAVVGKHFDTEVINNNSKKNTSKENILRKNLISSSSISGVLIIAPYASYRIHPFIKAATELSAKVIIASEGRFALTFAGAKGVNIKFQNSDEAIKALIDISITENINAVIGTDDGSVLLANEIAARLNLPHNNPQSILASRSKALAREMLSDGAVNIPEYFVLDLDQPLAGQIESITYPCVVKPVNLSMSRGVIRANNINELLAACTRVEAILVQESKTDISRTLLVERFIAGQEIALEGILYNGVLQVLAIFDKPDLMDGPYFEETYYTTPSRLSSDKQLEIVRTISAACQAMGLHEGPVHAECRINNDGVWVLELAARTIGGMCSRLFEFATGQSLEAIVINHALGHKLKLPEKRPAAGVMMIPTPKAGILRRVEGLSAAKKIKHVDEVVISVREGYELMPLPEGASYLGFIFSTAPSPAEAENALRQAYAELKIVIAPLWKGVVAT